MKLLWRLSNLRKTKSYQDGEGQVYCIIQVKKKSNLLIVSFFVGFIPVSCPHPQIHLFCLLQSPKQLPHTKGLKLTRSEA